MTAAADQPAFVELADPPVRIAYDEYGDRDGEPVMFCHGWPASRTQAWLVDHTARDLSLRLISPDRPGIGLSTFQPRRKLLDWPPLMERLADELGLGKFRILAVSGGAPYALATAWALGDRVTAVALVCGAPPLSDLSDMSGLLRLHRWLLRGYRLRPGPVRMLLRSAGVLSRPQVPAWVWPWVLRFVPEPDASALKNPETLASCYESFRAAWRACREGVLADAEIYAQPWGFPLDEVHRPVRLWHGKADRTFSWKLACGVADNLPICTGHYIDDEGHYSLPIRRAHEILSDLKTAGRNGD